MKRLAAGVLTLAGILLAGCTPGPASEGSMPSYAPADPSAARSSAPAAAPGPSAGARLAALLGATGSPPEVVLLGDSFAAGEGAGSYLPVDGVDRSLCHRSAAGLLSETRDRAVVHNLACSRARIQHLGSAQQMPGHGAEGIAAQLDRLGGLDPDLVLLHIGGNDAGFAGLLQACLVEDEPCNRDAGLRQAVKQQLRDLRTPLTELYTELGTTLRAPVLVLPYPRLFEGSEETCGRLSPEERSFGVDITDALNSTIEQSVTAAGLPGVRYVDALEDSFAGRGACSTNPLVVTARLGPLLTAAASESAAQEVLHPTGEGYRVLTGDLLQWLENHPL